MSDKIEDIDELVKKYGLRYVIRNYILSPGDITMITLDCDSYLYEELDVTIDDIERYQECLKKSLKK